MEVIIGSTTAAVDSNEITIKEDMGYNYPSFPATIWAWNLDPEASTAEEILIKFPTDVEGQYQQVDKLTASSPSLALNSPLEFIVVKPTTNYEVGVAMSALGMQFSKEPY